MSDFGVASPARWDRDRRVRVRLLLAKLRPHQEGAAVVHEGNDGRAFEIDVDFRPGGPAFGGMVEAAVEISVRLLARGAADHVEGAAPRALAVFPMGAGNVEVRDLVELVDIV